MSADEDTELRDLVAQTLEFNGVLGKIRAQLRASVFLALEEQDSVQNKTPFLNHELKKFLTTKEGHTALELVREFLECFNLEFTQAVFEPESGATSQYEGRNALAKDLNIPDSTSGPKLPLLVEVLKRSQGEATQGKAVSSSDAMTVYSRLAQPKVTEDKAKVDSDKFVDDQMMKLSDSKVDNDLLKLSETKVDDQLLKLFETNSDPKLDDKPSVDKTDDIDKKPN